MMRPAKNAPKASEAPAAAVPSAVSVPIRMTAIRNSSRLRVLRISARARGTIVRAAMMTPTTTSAAFPNATSRPTTPPSAFPARNGSTSMIGNHAEILKNQDAGRETAVRGVDLTGIGQHLQHDGGTRQRDQEREKQCHPPAAQEAEADRQRRQDRKTHLRETAGENLPPHLLQPAERELDADREQQEDHADFSESLHIVRI